ncbi:MAG: hypothetical protein GX357_02435 [Firmicutes bacterium]|mgnify:FL=1|nr:hypothetical protein [Bacillota bacterium]
MNFIFKLPYAFLSAEQVILFNLEAENLTIETSNSADKTLIMADCTGFCAAKDKQNTIHLLATDRKNHLTYCLLENGDMRILPFISTKAPAYYALAFGPSGTGYYCAQDKNKITLAVLHSSQKWEVTELKIGVKPAPVGLAIDQIGYAHLLLYDLAEHSLWYVTADRHHFSKPLQLAEDLPQKALPAFLLDSVQNIHIAWVEEEKLHYRLRLAGGWPTGGWQRPAFLSLSYRPHCLAFTDHYPHPQIWLLDDSNFIHHYNTDKLSEIKQAFFDEKQILIRTDFPTANNLSLLTIEPDITLLANITRLAKEERSILNTPTEEEENPLLLHARRLMSEKKRLEYELSKREASLAQLRQMLELSQENVKRQTILLNEKMSDVNAKVRELQSKNKILEAKCQDYQEQFRLAKQNLETAKLNNQKWEEQYVQVKNELASALKREKSYLRQIKELQTEVAAKKNMWQTFSSMFQRITSADK